MPIEPWKELGTGCKECIQNSFEISYFIWCKNSSIDQIEQETVELRILRMAIGIEKIEQIGNESSWRPAKVRCL